MTSVLHLAMHEDPITKIFLHLSFHYLLSAEGSFSVGKLLNTQGEQSRYLCQCHGGKIMQLMYPGQPAGCVRSSTVLWNLLAASTASNTRAQISCVLLSLHSWHRACHKILQSSGLPFNSWAWWQQMSLEKSTGAVMGDNFGKQGVGLCWLWLESECHCPALCLHVEKTPCV